MAFNSSAEAKKEGWFSRRHETRDAHDEARIHFMTKVNTNNAPHLGYDKKKLHRDKSSSN